MTGRAWPIDAVAGEPEYAARHGRQTSLAPLLAGARASRPLGAVSGVRPGTPSTTVEVSGSTWTVHPHAGILDVQVAAEAGPYGFAFDADVSDEINPPHATLTRWDALYVVLDDPAEDESSVPELRIEYRDGSTTPALPTAPDRSMRLCRLVVPPSGGGSASVVWDPPVCAAAGGLFLNPPAAQMTALDAIASASGPVWVDDNGVLKRSVGSGLKSLVDWGAYTPVLTRATVGNGTVQGWWSRVGDLVQYSGRFVLGSTSSISAAAGNNTVGVSFPPVTPAAFYGTAGTDHDLGSATFLSAGVQIYFGRITAEASLAEAKLYCMSSNPIVRGAVNATTPFTFKATDVLSWTGQYVAAS